MVTEFKYPPGALHAFAPTVYAEEDDTAYTIPSEGKKAPNIPGRALYHAYHYKCFKVMLKIEKRTADERSLVGSMPDAYHIQELTMNADEARDRGISLEDAAKHTTSAMADKSVEALHRNIEAARVVKVEKEDDPSYDPDKEKDLAWPAGGQVDVEL
jgi:hypothetical protein